jgi:hypothetical protein
MEYNFEVITDPKIKQITENQQFNFNEFCWVSPKVIPDTPLGSDWKPKPCVMLPQ